MTGNNEQAASKHFEAESTEVRDYIKVPPKQKVEEFDFHEYTEDLANSLSDKMYLNRIPEIAAEKTARNKKYPDSNIRNDMVVDNLAKKIDGLVNEKVSESVSNEVSRLVVKQLREQYKATEGTPEHFFDKLIIAMRWAIAPFFLLIIVILLCIGFVLAGETWLIVLKTVSFILDSLAGKNLSETSINAIQAGILSVLDLILISSLVVMVAVGGYENTVSRIGMAHNLPSWFGKLDIGQLKIKVAASIVIISSIHLLMTFMDLGINMDEDWNSAPLMWTAITHVVFVLSALALAYMDRIQGKYKN